LHIITDNQIIYGNHSCAYSSLQKIYSEASGLFTQCLWATGFQCTCILHSFFCNLLGSHLCWLYTSEIRINHFFDWKKNQQFLFGFISTKGSAKIGNQTKAGKRDWATALGLGRDYSRLSALFAFSIEFLFSHSYSQACILMGTPNRRHRLHVYGWRWRKTTLLATFWLGYWGIVVLY
jgi:hypothetical protein